MTDFYIIFITRGSKTFTLQILLCVTYSTTTFSVKCGSVKTLYNEICDKLSQLCVCACVLLCTISLEVCGTVYISGTNTVRYYNNDNIPYNSRLSGHKPTNILLSVVNWNWTLLLTFEYPLFVFYIVRHPGWRNSIVTLRICSVRFFMSPLPSILYCKYSRCRKRKQSNDTIEIINILKNLIGEIFYMFSFQPVFSWMLVPTPGLYRWSMFFQIRLNVNNRHLPSISHSNQSSRF